MRYGGEGGAQVYKTSEAPVKSMKERTREHRKVAPPVSRVVPARFGISLSVTAASGLDGSSEPHRRGVRFRVCKDRSDVLFELSAAEDRRLYTPESARDQSDAYLMLMAF